MNYAPLVKESTTATSTATIALSGAAVGFRSFAQSFAVGATQIAVTVRDAATGAFEDGEYTLTSSTLLTRTGVVASSNGGAAVAFAAGTKTVICALSASQTAKFNATIAAPFSVAVPLSSAGTAFMPQQSVTGALAFTVGASPIQGALVYLRLVANGANIPTFTGMKEWGGSLGYNNTNGIVNELQFFYDGYDYWYTISQAVGATAVDSVVPTATSAAVANASPTVVSVITSEALDPAFVPAASTMTVGGHTPSSVSVSGASFSVTCSTPFVFGEASRTLAYTQNGTNNLRDLAGNLLANIASLAITNNVAAVDSTAPTLSSASGTQTGTTTANAAVTTAGDANGTLYVLVSTSATPPTAAAIKASAFSQAITTTGAKVIAYTGLTAATVYYFHFLHRDAAGNDSAILTSASFTTAASATAPATMVAPVATGGDTVATVALTAPSDGGSAITGYTVTSIPGGMTDINAGMTSLSHSMTGGSNGTAYTFTATATNAVGTSAASPASNSVTLAAAGPSPRLGLLSGITETGTGPYTYTGTGGNYTASPGPGGVLTTSLASSASGSVAMEMDGISASKAPIIGLVFNSNLTAFSSLTFGIFAQLSSNSYKVLVSGAVTTANVSVLIPAVGDRMRLRRAGTAMIAEISRAATPTSFTVIHNFAATSSTALFAQLLAAGDGVITNIATVGFA